VAEERCAVIVQARMGSSRLPGKSLLPFGASTLLQHVVERLRRMQTPVDLVVATSTNPEDDAIADACRTDGVAVFRGDPDDVLARFAGAVASLPVRPTLVLRVCADRPLVDPDLADELLAAYAPAGRPAYLSNTLAKSYPDGLDLELVRTDALLAGAAEAGDPYEREHVTPFVYRRPERFSLVGYDCPYGNHSGVRVTIDTLRDYEALRSVDERLRLLVGAGYDWRAVLTLSELEPELFP
jgi:spore coat polysaccharide biosynthesis protein SpsF